MSSNRLWMPPRRVWFGLLLVLAGCLLPASVSARAVIEQGRSETVRPGADGRLVYSADARGNRLPDFSYVGYHSGEKAIPDVPVRLTLEPGDGDDTSRIQDALDRLGEATPDADGVRGALLLRHGAYRVSGKLFIRSSGVVLRGEGSGPDGTVLVATGYGREKDKRTLLSVGNSKRVSLEASSKRRISDAYVPIGARAFDIESADGYQVGDRIILYRPATAEWITSIGCDQLKPKWKTSGGKRVDQTVQWNPESYGLAFERRIVALDGTHVTIDAPNVHPLDAAYGGGAIYHYEAPGRVSEVGIENLRLMSEFSDPVPGNPYGDPKLVASAEQHGWNGIKLSRNTENTWVRGVSGKYFGWSLVSASGKRATVQDCASLGHASKITGGRRYPFMIDGQLNLVQRCVTYGGRHEFVNQARTAGPNVFVDCVGYASKSSAGPHHRYAVGNLYDNVTSGRGMESRFRGNSGTGHGWAGTQTCFYNCVAPGFSVKAPPGGISWVVGCDRSFKASSRVTPASLYYQQVEDRLGLAAVGWLVTTEQREQVGHYQWVAELLHEK